MTNDDNGLFIHGRHVFCDFSFADFSKESSMNTDDQYKTHIDNLTQTLAQDHALGRDIDLSMCVCGLAPGRIENSKVRDFCIKTLKVKASDFDKALQREATKAEFGTVPQTASEFVEIMAADSQMAITASYNGILRLNRIPFIVNASREREYIPAGLWDSYDFKTMIETTFRRVMPFFEFQREVRIVAREFNLPFASDELNDAAERWYDEVCRNRLWKIMGSIDYTDSLQVRARGQASLRQLAETCFDCSDGVEFVVAVFNKFIWQVKRKIEGLPVTDHLMPVVLGVQGNGKSTLIRQMLAPIAELVARADFSEITDNRNIRLWRNFVIFMDEMGTGQAKPTLTR
jgi:hypothetical protein